MHIRPAIDQDYVEVERLVLDSFEPVTWARTLDEKFGLLNGLDWQARCRIRRKTFAAACLRLPAI